MRVFVDTSAWLAVMDQDDYQHRMALKIWTVLIEGRHHLWTSNYVLVETLALLQRRLGLEALRSFQLDIVPLLEVAWVDGELHNSAMMQVILVNHRRLSLVDCLSFELLHRSGDRLVFAFDRHFSERGFDCLPSTTLPETMKGQ